MEAIGYLVLAVCSFNSAFVACPSTEMGLEDMNEQHLPCIKETHPLIDTEIPTGFQQCE